MRLSVAIVGGGITGLATAYYLEKTAAQLGWDLSAYLIESEARLGGKVLSEQDGGFVLEGGPDELLTYKPWALRLVRELGLEGEVITRNTSRFYLLHRGRLRLVPEELAGAVPRSLWGLWTSPLLSWQGKARASLEPFIPQRRDAADEAVGTFLRRRLGHEWTQRLGEPMTASIYAGDAERLSLLALFPTLADWERSHKSLSRGLRQARALARGARPSQPFVSLVRGLASLTQAIVPHLPSHHVFLGRRAISISRSPNSASSRFGVLLDNGERLEASHVVLTTPSYSTATLLRDIAPAAAELLVQLPYVSTASVTLAFRDDQVTRPLDGSGFLVPRGEPFPLTGCSWSSAKWPRRVPKGFALVRAFLGQAGDQNMLEQDDAGLTRRATEALRPILGLRGQPARVWVHRWPRAMPQYEVGHLDWLAAVDRALADFPGLLLAGSAYRGIGVPDCVRQGQEAAERIRQLASSSVNVSYISG